MDKKVAVVGSRSFNDFLMISNTLKPFVKDISMIISGGATGVDELAYRFAVDNGITFVCYPPVPSDGPTRWSRRNLRIAEACEVMIAFPGPDSKGTHHAISLAKRLGKQVKVIKVDA